MRVLEHFLAHKTDDSRHQITQFKRVTPFNASNHLTRSRRLTLSVYLTLYNIFYISQSNAMKDIKIKPTTD